MQYFVDVERDNFWFKDGDQSALFSARYVAENGLFCCGHSLAGFIGAVVENAQEIKTIEELRELLSL